MFNSVEFDTRACDLALIQEMKSQAAALCHSLVVLAWWAVLQEEYSPGTEFSGTPHLIFLPGGSEEQRRVK